MMVKRSRHDDTSGGRYCIELAHIPFISGLLSKRWATVAVFSVPLFRTGALLVRGVIDTSEEIVPSLLLSFLNACVGAIISHYGLRPAVKK